MSSRAIAVRHLSVVRGRSRALRRVSFDVEPGTVVGLIGPSGSGKTTLIRTLVGLQKMTEGAVDILGLGAGSAALRDRVGYMAQSPSVYDDLTVRQNVSYFAHILGYPHTEVERVIRQVDLAPQRRQMVGTLSGGQRARVSLAIAMLGRPALLVLDEPTVGLDPVLRQSLWSLFRQLADDGVTLVISSHVMEEASLCDRLLLLRNGKIIADDTVRDILRQTGARDVESAFLALVDTESANV